MSDPEASLASWTIKTKLLSGVLGVVLVGMCALMGVVSKRTDDVARREAYTNASLSAAQYGDVVRSQIDQARDTAKHLAASLVALKASGKPDRALADQLQATYLRDHPQYFGVWTGWEPNAFDGRDRALAGSTGTDDTGRYIPYWHRNGDQIGLDPLVDYETAGAGDYYVIPKQTGKEKIIDPYSYNVNNTDTLMTSVAEPITIDGKFAGVAGVDIVLPTMQAFINGLHPDKTGQVWLVSASGQVVAAPDASLATKPLPGSAGAQAKSAISSGTEQHYVEKDPFTKHSALQVVVPIKLTDVDTWALTVSIPMSTVLHDRNVTLVQIVAIGVLALLAVMAGVYVLARAVAGSIGRQSRAVRRSSDQLEAISSRLNGSAARTAAEAAEVATSADDMSNNIATVAAAIEEMSASVDEIARNASHATSVASEAVAEADRANSTVVELGHASTEIGAVVDVITSISEQTNLLALNATIEAARAGEAGKGFAVVANEVKELAKQTAQATEEISTKIGGIQDGSTAAVDAIARISEVIGRIAETQSSIASAVEEQTVTTNEISRSVSDVAGGATVIAGKIQMVARAADETMDGAAETAQAADDLRTTADDLTALVERPAATSAVPVVPGATGAYVPLAARPASATRFLGRPSEPAGEERERSLQS